MYSSRQKSRLIKLPKKLECPSCGLVAMVAKKGTTTMADGYKIHDVNRWICNNCGEEVFDAHAMAEIRSQRAVKSKKAYA